MIAEYIRTLAKDMYSKSVRAGVVSATALPPIVFTQDGDGEQSEGEAELDMEE